MIAEPSATPSPLSLHERRVLGVLVEKAKTTPDIYPLSLNALITGCNQKSNREPVLELTDLDAEAALESAQQKGFAIKITGGRVERWRHHLYEAWKVDKVELAVLGELLLRGPQTEGELRGRASRMEPIADVDALRPVLRSLAERGLIVYLTPEGRRGTTVTHGFHSAQELQRLRLAAGTEAHVPSEPTMATPAVASPQKLEASSEVRTEFEMLRAALAEVQKRVGELESQLQSLKQALGE